MARVTTAIVGTGFMGRVHLEAILRLGYVEVRAVCGRRAEAARSLADAFGVAEAVTDYRAILDDPAIQAIHICTPNRLHAPMASAALEAGKHVLSEKPLAMSSDEARMLADLAERKGLRNCTCHNLRYYPLVQEMRSMRESGELGEILVVQGTYSQDWLLHDTDWNWRADSAENGPSRALADIGSHWCDMAEHVTGERLHSLVADLQTWHPTRKRPRGHAESFTGSGGGDGAYTEIPIDSEDFGSVMFRMGARARGAFTASQMSAGRKNRLSIEIYGSLCGVTWDQERPNELWIGHRDGANQLLLKDPGLMSGTARTFAQMPAGHTEGYPDTFKQVFERFYQSILDENAQREYPSFRDGLRQMEILDAELASHRERRWVEVAI